MTASRAAESGGRTRVGVLGPLVVVAPGQPEHLPGARRQRRLLEALAAAALSGRVLGTDDLLAAVYGDDVGAGSRRALATEIWRCRQVLGSGDAIRGDHDGYALEPDVVEVDAVRFVELLEAGRDALHGAEADRAERLLSDAALLWRGDPVPDWLDDADGRAFVARMVELRVGGQEDHAEALAALGRHRDAIGELRAITADHPYREHAWALLVECYVELGDRRRARSALDSARRMLAEHGVELGTELRAARDMLHGRGVAASVPAPSGLIGRETARAAVLPVVQRALSERRPDVALVMGEAGIGKTAFVESLVATLGRSATVERIACDLRLTLPLGVVTPMLERLCASTDQHLPDVEDAVAAAVDRDAAAALLAASVETAADRLGGLVLLVEDVHWATPDLLDLLITLKARAAHVPLAVVATLRAPAAVEEPVRSLLTALRRRSGVVQALTGLSESECAELLGSGTSFEVVSTAHRLTGGNPLYLRSLDPAGGSHQLPASIDEALDEHIDSLPLEILAVLELAAAIGTAFDSRTLVAAAARLPDPIDATRTSEALHTATRVGVLRPVAARLRREFVHGLIRDRLYQRTPAAARIAAHAAIHQALTTAMARETPGAELVAHHALSGWPTCPTAEVVRALEAAGAEASRHLAFERAHEYYRLALDLIGMNPLAGPQDDAPDLTRLLSAAGQTAVASDDVVSARLSYRTLIDHGRAGGLLEPVLEGCVGLLQTFANERVDATVLDELVAALCEVSAGASPAPDAGLLAEALGVLTMYRPDVAGGLTEQITVSYPECEARVLRRVWEQESVAGGARIVARLLEMGRPSQGTLLRQWVGEVAAGTRRLDDRPAGWLAASGDAEERWESHLWLTTVAIGVGDFARADRLLDAAQDLTVQASSPRDRAAREAQILGQAMWLAHLRADHSTLLELLPRSPDNWSVRRPIQRVMATFTAPVLLPPDEAWKLVDEVVDEFEEGVVPGRHQLGPVIALATGCLGIGHDRGIALTRELLRAHAGEQGQLYFVQYWGQAEYHSARLAAALGEYDEAVGLLETSLADYRAIGARCFEAWTLRILATVRHVRNRGDDRDAAARLHQEARSLALEIGMGVVAEAAWPPRAALDILASRAG